MAVGDVEYRAIGGFPGYRVGSDGSVWSCRSRNGSGSLAREWRRILPRWSRQGYGQVLLYGGTEAGRAMRLVQHLILEAFTGTRPEGMQACHDDGDKRNNAVGNLRWDTPKGNHADRIRHGTSGRGEANSAAKVTEDGVREIRRRVASGECYQDIAPDFRLTPCAVSLIARRKTWAHVEG